MSNKEKRDLLLKSFTIFISVFLGVLIFNCTTWAIKTFDSLEIGQIIYHLKVPLIGTESSMVFSFINGPLLTSFLIALGVTITFIFLYLKFKLIHQYSFYFIIISIIINVFLIYNSFVKLGVNEYLMMISHKSSFIEENYINGQDVNIKFPNNKRNLIYIYLESMETTYLSKELGGSFKENLIPNLSILANEGINFSSNSGIGGYYSPTCTGWTIAALFAHTSGLHLDIPIDTNNYEGKSAFFPGVYTLGDILESEGYNQEFFIGSDAKFGGRDLLFKQHGNFEIRDYYSAFAMGRLPEDYFVWWGFEDSKLYDYAKQELNNLAEKNEPFNFTMLTTNTHHQDGYLEQGCEIKFDDKFYNAIYCSDKMLYEFIKWIKEQSFYENTTVIIVGDHKSMNKGTFDNIKDEDRAVYNVILNSDFSDIDSKNRIVTSFDFFPTALASLNVEIEGNRLGLGVNLFSDEKTLAEEIGLEELNKQLNYYSDYYVDELMSEK